MLEGGIRKIHMICVRSAWFLGWVCSMEIDPAQTSREEQAVRSEETTVDDLLLQIDTVDHGKSV